MARSSYIYVVTRNEYGDICCAFTVKYECARWLSENHPEKFTVTRVPDGLPGGRVVFVPGEQVVQECGY